MTPLLSFAEEPPPEQPRTVFSVTSTLVQVDAVVTDSKGRHVSDLAASDFEVLEDGVPQQITHFSYVRIAGPNRQVPSEVPVRKLQQQEVRRTIVLMVDDLGLSWESMARVRYSLRRFVEKQMQPGDLIAVCRTAAGIGALQQFTADKRLLLSIIDGLRWNPRGRSGVRSFELYPEVGPLRPDTGKSWDRGGSRSIDTPDPLSGDSTYAAQQRRVFTVGTLGAISYIVRAMREMPGRKSIVLFSDGMGLFSLAQSVPMHKGGEDESLGLEPDAEVTRALRSLIDLANRAGTVIYTMQATGLQTLMAGAADNVQLSGLDAQQRQQALTEAAGVGQRSLDYQLEQQGLGYLAHQTGGFPYQNGNDLNWGLDRILEEQQEYYLIGYKPSEETFAQKHGAASYHQIRVNVKCSGLHVRSRTGFFGETDEHSIPRYTTVAEQLQAAMLSPFHSSGIRLRLTALYGEVPKIGSVVRNLLHIEAHDLLFNLAPDGSAVAKVGVLAVATGAGDVPLATVAREYTFEIAGSHFQQAMDEGVLYTMDVPVKKRGAYQIRVAIRDQATEKIGSASQFLDVPDLKKGRMALTSVVLWNPRRSGESARVMGITAARRQFVRGSDVSYGCVLQQGKKQPRNSPLEASIRVFRDDAQVFAGAAQLSEVQDGVRAVTGTLRLGTGMKPGDYYLQVVARETGDQKKAAVQWTDFEVLP